MANPFDDILNQFGAQPAPSTLPEMEVTPDAAPPAAPATDPFGANPFASAVPAPGFAPEVPNDEGIVGTTVGAATRGWYGLRSNLDVTTADAMAREIERINKVEQQRALHGLPLPPRLIEQREKLRAAVGENLASAVGHATERAKTRPPKDVEAAMNAKTFNDWWENFKKAPIPFIYTVGIESAVQNLPGYAAMIPAGMVAGPVGVGATMGLSSASTEYASGLMDALNDEGIDVRNVEAVKDAFADPDRMERIRKRAAIKAGVVGSFDAASAGIAGRVLPGISRIPNPYAMHGANIVGQVPLQGVMGGAGEGLGQLASGQELQWGPVMSEFAGEAFSAPAEIAGMRHAGRHGTAHPSPTEQFNASQVKPTNPFADLIAAAAPAESPTEAPVAPTPVGPTAETPPPVTPEAPAPAPEPIAPVAAEPAPRSVDELGYYSAALEAAREWKQPRGTPNQAIKYLKSKGVKDAEIEATGLEAFLADKKSVTREELASFLEQNRTRLLESYYQGHEFRTRPVEGFEHKQVNVPEDAAGPTKFSNYSLDPTNPTYQERIVHLPEKINEDEKLEFDKQIANARAAGDIERINRLLRRKDANGAKDNFRSGHFPQPNIVGHYQASQQQDSAGKKVFTLSQIQSDWGQAVRDSGVRNEARIADLKMQLADAKEANTPEQAKAFIARAEGVSVDDIDEMYGYTDPQDYVRNVRQTQRRLEAELTQMDGPTAPANPLVNTTDQWTNTTLRRALKDAVDSGAESIAIPSGETVLSYNPGDEHGMAEFYNKIVPKNLGNILRKMDPSIKPTKTATLKSHDGTKDLGKGFTVFPITDKVRAEVKRGQPMYAKTMNEIVGDQLAKGKSFNVIPKVSNQVLAVQRDMAKMVPDGTRVGTAIRFEPISYDEAKVTVKDIDGNVFDMIDSIDAIRDTGALYDIVDGTPSLVSYRTWQLASDADHSVRGQVAHEGVHALWRALPKAARTALIRHGDVLDIMMTGMKTAMLRSGLPNQAERASDNRILFQVYHENYKDRKNYRDAMQQEIAAHMLQWYVTGALTPEQVAPVKHILDGMLNGDYARGAKKTVAQTERSDATQMTESPMFSLTGDGRENDNNTQPPAIPLTSDAIDYMRAGNEGGGGRGGPPRDGDVLPPSPPGDRGGPSIESKPKIDSEPNKSLLDKYHALGRRLMAWYNPITGIPGFDQYLLGKYRTLGSIDTAEDVSKLIHKGLKGASNRDVRATYDYLTKRDADPRTIADPRVRETAVYVKLTMDMVGRALVERGLLSDESYQKYRGEYLPRLYLKHLIKDKKLNLGLSGGTRPSKMPYLKSRDVDLDAEVRALLGEIKDPAFLASRGIFRPLRDIAILDFLNEISKDGTWTFQESLVPYNGRRVSPYYLRAEAVALRDRAVLAEQESPQNAAKMRAEADRLDSAAAPYIQKEQKVPEGYERVPDTPRYGMLRGMLVRKEIKRDLLPSMSIVPDDAPYLQQIFKQGGGWQRLNSYFKAFKVPLNPSTQIRNFISNNIMLNLSGVPAHRIPVLMARAAKEMYSNGEYWRFAKSHGLKASGFSEQEMGKVAREYLKIERQMALQGKAGYAMYPLTIARQIVDAGIAPLSTAYQAVEAMGKMAKMIDAHERQDMPLGQAYLEAQKWLFDYNTIPNWVRHLRNAPFGMPFLTYSYLVLPRIIETAATKPWRMAPYVAIPFVMAEMFKLANGVDDDDWKKLLKTLPEWLRKNPNVTILPYKDAKGRWQAYNYGYLLPWGMFQDAASDLMRGDVGDMRKTLGIFQGPGSQMLAALTTGIDSFSGKPIWDNADPPSVKFGKLMTYMARTALPPLLTDQSAVKKMWDSYKDTPTKGGDPAPTMGQSAMRLLGQNIYPIEPEISRQRNISRMKKEIRDIEIKRKYETVRDKSITPAERAERRKTYDTFIKEKKDELRKYMKESALPEKLRTDIRGKKASNPFSDLLPKAPASNPFDDLIPR